VRWFASSRQTTFRQAEHYDFLPTAVAILIQMGEAIWPSDTQITEQIMYVASMKITRRKALPSWVPSGVHAALGLIRMMPLWTGRRRRSDGADAGDRHPSKSAAIDRTERCRTHATTTDAATNRRCRTTTRSPESCTRYAAVKPLPQAEQFPGIGRRAFPRAVLNWNSIQVILLHSNGVGDSAIAHVHSNS
jgi:hypothetical protein